MLESSLFSGRFIFDKLDRSNREIASECVPKKMGIIDQIILMAYGDCLFKDAYQNEVGCV